MIKAEVLDTQDAYLVGYRVEENRFYVICEFQNKDLAYAYADRVNNTTPVR